MSPLQIAQAVRAAAEAHYPRCKTLKDRCVPVAIALTTLLQEAGYRACFTEGLYGRARRRHCWVEVGGGPTLDLTLTQFRRSADPVTVVSLEAREKDDYIGLRHIEDAHEVLAMCVGEPERKGAAAILAAAQVLLSKL